MTHSMAPEHTQPTPLEAWSLDDLVEALDRVTGELAVVNERTAGWRARQVALFLRQLADEVESRVGRPGAWR